MYTPAPKPCSFVLVFSKMDVIGTGKVTRPKRHVALSAAAVKVCHVLDEAEDRDTERVEHVDAL